MLAAQAQQRAGVVLDTVRQITHAEQISAPGVLAPDEARTARIGSLQEALVLETQALIGDHVRAGQLLATMHGHAVHDAWAGYRKAMPIAGDSSRVRVRIGGTVTCAATLRRQGNLLQERQRAELDQVSAREQVDMADAEVRRSRRARAHRHPR